MTYKTCEYCGRTISTSVYGSHIRRHKEHPETFLPAPHALTHEGLDCQYCGKTCKSRNSLCNHERLCQLNPDRDITHNGFNVYNQQVASGDRTVWCKGLTKETDERLLHMSVKLSNATKGKVFSKETRDKLSKSVKAAYQEGRLGERLHRVKHDKNCYGTYKGYECDSSWELAYLIYNLDHNIPIVRNHDYFEYQFNGQTHKYFPDFIVDNEYIEIKGIITEKDKAKFEYFPRDRKLVVIDDTSIEKYIKYCKETYGNFTELYDRNFPSYLDKINAGVV